MEQTANRRKTSRHRLNCPVRIREGGVAASLNASVSDISLQGCYIETLQPFPLGTRLELDISTSDGNIRAGGTVCSVHPRTGMGISFDQIDEEDRARLIFVVKDREERGVGESF